MEGLVSLFAHFNACACLPDRLSRQMTSDKIFLLPTALIRISFEDHPSRIWIARSLFFLSFCFCYGIAVAQTGVSKSKNAQDQNLKVALVIGNAAYPEAPLKNTLNDARDVAKALRQVGFDVVFRENLVIRGIGSALQEFKSKLRKGSTALVFYAGHGVQLRGENYFIAPDALIGNEEDVPNQSLSLKQIMEVLEDSKADLSLLFLDACRNNPFASTRSRGMQRGLASVNAPSGMLISYATRPGAVADDGAGRNGVFTGELLKFFGSTLPVELVVKKVASNVKTITKGRQEPWSEGSISGDFCFGGCADLEKMQANVEAEAEQWLGVRSSKSPDDFSRFIDAFPSGIFVRLAEAIRGKLVLEITEQKIREAEKNNVEKLKQELELKQLAALKREEEVRRLAEARNQEEMRAQEIARLAAANLDRKERERVIGIIGEETRLLDRLKKLKDEEEKYIRESENARIAKLKLDLGQREAAVRVRENEANKVALERLNLIKAEEVRATEFETAAHKKFKVVVFPN